MTAIVDTNFLVSLTNPKEATHEICATLARTLPDRFLVPYVVLPEATYMINKYQGHHIMLQFVRRMMQPSWNFEPLLPVDFARVSVILDKYHDMDLDFVDAAVVALAERLNITRVLTLDQRHFRVIRPSHCAAFEILPGI
ncbi:MAG: PIN domain-containing protein [Aquificales bacterium]|nr:PIN domain-containing protein [Aquificales bacterium]